jgi:hypothetical protein
LQLFLLRDFSQSVAWPLPRPVICVRQKARALNVFATLMAEL